MQELTGAKWISNFLVQNNCAGAFYLTGGMIAFLIDELHHQDAFPVVACTNEQAAGFAAESATRISGRPSVALATSGPGATNLVTAVASCYFDSSPVIFITGQVNQKELRKNNKQRQNGFQELNIVELVSSITKFSYQVKNVEEIPSVISKAWHIAQSGRSGPVLLDIPINLQYAEINSCEEITNANLEYAGPIIPIYDKINKALQESKRPLVIAGGGIRLSDSISEFEEFINKSNLPVVTTLMGKDAITSENSNNLGFIGSYGNRWANEYLKASDTLLVLGSRLDPRQIPENLDLASMESKRILRIDIDNNELLYGRITASDNFNINLKEFLFNWNFIERHSTSRKLILDNYVSNSYIQENEQSLVLNLNPNSALGLISKLRKDTAGYLVDVGQHQMWAAQSIQLSKGQRFITSGGLGAMGFSLPALIGATACSQGTWNVILGDGCFRLSLGELFTLKSLGSQSHIYLFNNNQLGMVAQFQENNLESRFYGSVLKDENFQYEKLAVSFDLNYEKVDSLELLEAAILKPNLRNKPTLFELQISKLARALPKL